MIYYKHGDCKDASIGTLLMHYGVLKPESIIFKNVRFLIRKTDDAYRRIELLYRTDDYMDEITRELGIGFDFYTAPNIDDFLEAVKANLGENKFVVIVVDHYEYIHSQFFKSGHMPHFVILTKYDAVNDLYHYEDPFPIHDKHGVLSSQEISCLCDSPYLLEQQNSFFVFNLTNQRGFDYSSYLMDTWEETIEKNIEYMLDQAEYEEGIRGVAAIRKMASYLEDWCSDENFEPFQGENRKFPINSFLDLGSNRAGHALYLKLLGDLLEEPMFFKLAEEFKKISTSWDMVSSIRNFYQEQSMIESYDVSKQFIEKNLKRVPLLLNAIADMEEEVFTTLNNFMESRDC